MQIQRHHRSNTHQTSKDSAEPGGVQHSLQNLQAVFALSLFETERQTRSVGEFRHTDESERDLHVEVLQQHLRTVPDGGQTEEVDLWSTHADC